MPNDDADTDDELLPHGKHFWELGLEANWPHINHHILKKYENVAVVDQSSESKLAHLSEEIDTSISPNDKTNMVYKLVSDVTADRSCSLLKRVLGLGVRPDVPNSLSWHPIEAAVRAGNMKCAHALALCRPERVDLGPHASISLEIVSYLRNNVSL